MCDNAPNVMFAAKIDPDTGEAQVVESIFSTVSLKNEDFYENPAVPGENLDDAEKLVSKLVLVCCLANTPDHAKFCGIAVCPFAAKLRDAQKAEIARRRE